MQPWFPTQQRAYSTWWTNSLTHVMILNWPSAWRKQTCSAKVFGEPPSITIKDYRLDVVHQFTYIGSTVTDSLSRDTEIGKKIGCQFLLLPWALSRGDTCSIWCCLFFCVDCIYIYSIPRIIADFKHRTNTDTESSRPTDAAEAMLEVKLSETLRVSSTMPKELSVEM